MRKNLSLFALVLFSALMLFLAAVFVFFPNGGEAESFTPPEDIEDHFAKDAIIYLLSHGYFDAEEGADGKAYFYPDKEITREEFARTIIRFTGADTAAYDSFALTVADIDKISEEALPDVRALVACGVMSVFIDGEEYVFLPDSFVLREEAAKSLGTLTTAVIATTKPDAFTDMSDTNERYINDLERLISLDIFVGYPDDTMKPKNHLTRGELALLLYRIALSDNF